MLPYREALFVNKIYIKKKAINLKDITPQNQVSDCRRVASAVWHQNTATARDAVLSSRKVSRSAVRGLRLHSVSTTVPAKPPLGISLVKKNKTKTHVMYFRAAIEERVRFQSVRTRPSPRLVWVGRPRQRPRGDAVQSGRLRWVIRRRRRCFSASECRSGSLVSLDWV